MSCSFCGQAHARTKGVEFHDLDFDLLWNFFDNCSLKGSFLYIWGGEPFLHPRWDEFILEGKLKEAHTQLNTNGWLLNKNLDRILNSQLDDLIVSIDGPKEIHDNLRCADSFDHSVSGIRNLISQRKEKRPSVTVNTVVTNSLLPFLSDFISEMMSLGLNGVVLELPTYITDEAVEKSSVWFSDQGWSWQDGLGFLADWRDFKVDEFLLLWKMLKKKWQQRVLLTPTLVNNNQIRKYFLEPNSPLGSITCPEIWLGMAIEPSGQIVACSDFPETVIGKISTTSCAKIWNGPQYQKIRSEFQIRKGFPYCLRCCQAYWKQNTND